MPGHAINQCRQMIITGKGLSADLMASSQCQGLPSLEPSHPISARSWAKSSSSTAVSGAARLPLKPETSSRQGSTCQAWVTLLESKGQQAAKDHAHHAVCGLRRESWHTRAHCSVQLVRCRASRTSGLPCNAISLFTWTARPLLRRFGLPLLPLLAPLRLSPAAPCSRTAEVFCLSNPLMKMLPIPHAAWDGLLMAERDCQAWWMCQTGPMGSEVCLQPHVIVHLHRDMQSSLGRAKWCACSSQRRCLGSKGGRLCARSPDCRRSATTTLVTHLHAQHCAVDGHAPRGAVAPLPQVQHAQHVALEAGPVHNPPQLLAIPDFLHTREA